MDTISVNGIMSEEGNRACREYDETARSVTTVDGKFLPTADTNMVNLAIFNLTRRPAV